MGLGFRVCGLGFWVHDWGFRVEFIVYGLEFEFESFAFVQV